MTQTKGSSLQRIVAATVLFTAGFSVANLPGVPDFGLASAQDGGRLEPLRADRAERDILLALEERRAALEAKEGEMTRRESHISDAEAQLNVKVAEMETLRAELTRLLAEETAYQEKKFKDMAKIHAEMSLSKSAVIIAKLSDPVAVKVLLNLKRERVAKTLAKMDPDRALLLSREYMGLKKEPEATSR